MTTDLVTTQRPAYVDEKPTPFVGSCTVFPVEDALLLGYQSKWVKDMNRLKAGQKSRQIGWSWATAYGIVRRKSRRKARLDAWISSRDEMQARLFLEDMKAFGEILEAGARDLGERVVDDKGNTAFILQFANQLRAHSMSSNPDAQAGKRGDRVLDEFALHADPRKLYSIAYPGITWGGLLELFSTHRGTANFFNEIIIEILHKGNPKKFSLHTVTLQDALDQGFLYKLQCKLPADDERQAMDEAAYFDYVRSGCADEESFLQEYMCVPADDNTAFLSYDLIASREYKPEEQWEYTLRELAATQNPVYIGVDVGRDHDLTVIWVLEKTGGVYLTRQLHTMQAMPFSAQEAALYAVLELPSVRRCCIDCTGIGRQFTERAQERFGTYRVEGVTFTMASKEEMAYPLRAAFEDGTIRIPSDRFVRSDLRSIKKVYTAGDNVRFAADRGKNGHADRFWALALALQAGKTAAGPFEWEGREPEQNPMYSEADPFAGDDIYSEFASAEAFL